MLIMEMGGRNGMINISPIGRNASIDERNEYERYDKQHNIRPKFVETLKEKFPDFGLTYIPPSLTPFRPSLLSFLPRPPLLSFLPSPSPSPTSPIRPTNEPS